MGCPKWVLSCSFATEIDLEFDTNNYFSDIQIFMIVVQCSGNPEMSIKLLKRRMQQELYFTKIREKRHYESPSEKARRKSVDAAKRRVKLRRARMLAARAGNS